MSKEAALEFYSIVIESDHDDPDGHAQDAKKTKSFKGCSSYYLIGV
jgi:hypothetical protein